jgi:N-acylglucosamine-6-phosphate 2-epimerase
VQAYAGSVLDAPETIAVLARCAADNGAAGVRVEGEARLRAVRSAVDVPIVGIIKAAHAGFEPYITSTLEEVARVAATGAEIVAFDATQRPRPDGVDAAALIRAIHAAGRLAFADCAEIADGRAAAQAGADFIATTLAGYTPATAGRSLPALDLVGAFAAFHPFAILEGGVGTPEQVRAAFAAGASAVVAGTALTNIDALVRRFAAAAPRGAAPSAD